MTSNRNSGVQGYVNEAMMAIIAFAGKAWTSRPSAHAFLLTNQNSIRGGGKILGFMPTGLEMLEFRGTEYPHRRYVLTLL